MKKNITNKLNDWKKLTKIKYAIEIEFNKERKRELIRSFENHFNLYLNKYQESYNPIEPPCKE